MLLPWLFPFAGGPSAAAQPLLFSWACCGVLALFAPTSRRAAGLLALAATGLALAVWAVSSDWLARAWLPPLGAALAAAVAAGIGAQRRLGGVVAWALLVAALASSLIGLCQYFDIAAAFHPWMNLSPAGEAFGNLRQRNQLASLLNIGLVALLWLVTVRVSAPMAAWRSVTGRSSRAIPAPTSIDGPETVPPSELYDTRDFDEPAGEPGALDAWVLPAAVLLAAGNAATASRTGFMQLLLVIALTWWWNRKAGADTRHAGWTAVLVAAAVAYAVAALLLPWLAGLDLTEQGLLARLARGAPACASRLVLWSNVLDLIAIHPWSGWGWGHLDYAHYVHLYDGPRFCDILDNAHNLPLQVAVELGVPAGILICGVLLWEVLAARPWGECDPARQFAWLVLVIVGLHSLLEYPLWYGPFQIACGLALGILLTTPQKPSWPAETVLSSQEHEVDRADALVRRSWTAILIVAICGFAAYDYWRVSQIYRPPEARAPAFRSEPISAVGASPLFPDQVRFAWLTTMPLTPETAANVNALAHELLRFSPEARVIERLIDSARLLGREDEARFHAMRFQAAFPVAFGKWAGPAAPATQGGDQSAR